MSIKVHWDHMDLVRACLAAPAGSRNRFAQLAPVVDFCWLRRRDTVRQAVSLFRARASNQWHSAQPRQSPPDRLEFDYPAIKELVAAITQWNSSWDRYFGDLAISPMALYYEDDLERDYRPAVTRILRMLEVEVPATLTLRAGPERQSDEQSEELVRRYHEAAAAKQQ
jgi:LPS sulfotransferase NodH